VSRSGFVGVAISCAAIALVCCAPDPAGCAKLAEAASASLVVDPSELACQSDGDCTVTFVDRDGLCAAPCGGLTNVASSAKLVAAAADACRSFDDLQCPPPELGCPRSPPTICAAGTCRFFDLVLSPLPKTVTVGTCDVFHVVFTLEGATTSSAAPHDVATTLTASGGTLYSDESCTTPMTAGTIIVPAGSTSIGFGFEASSPGNCFIGLGLFDTSFTAQ
jgi:hypothetical protein